MRAGTYTDDEVDPRPEAPDVFDKDYAGPVLDLTKTLSDDPEAQPVTIELVCNNRLGWGYTEYHLATFADGSTSGWPRKWLGQS